MVASPTRSYSYSISPDDLIRWVDRHWLAFARENGAASLTLERVIDRPLWEFIAGRATRTFYREVLRRVRETHQTLVIPFRCDSPRLRRYLRLEIHPAEENSIHFKSILQRVEPYTYQRCLEPGLSPGPSSLPICSCCKRVEVAAGDWLELDQAAARIPILASGDVPQLRHVICSDCPARVETMVAEHL